LPKSARQLHDERRELWRSVIETVECVKPEAVLFENVPGMTEGQNIFILGRLVEGLETCGYQVSLRQLAARAWGVPQRRERVFLVAVRSGCTFLWPEPARESATLRDAISDLPAVVGGEHNQWCDYAGPRTALQQRLRQGVPEADRFRLYDHYSRAVRSDDLEAFRLMDHGTKYSDLPDHLKRYRDDIFDDKYKRLAWDAVSRTITAHLAKDGYWYIHPEQHRTLTIREAARLQTFPDWFRFTGTPTHQFRQIGNAVPPLMAAAIGQAILACSATARRRVARKPGLGLVTPPAPQMVAMRKVLFKWWAQIDEKSLTRPWLKGADIWTLFLGMLLFERQPPRIVRDFGPHLPCAGRHHGHFSRTRAGMPGFAC
jgi:DNA (cytosine-5)-methyltransferase 1